MADRAIDDDGDPVLDVDDRPFEELDLDRVDDVAEQGDAIADLARRQRDWRYGHVIVDEAQDLSPMEWRMVARRAIGRSMTIVGDIAQRTAGSEDAGTVAGWAELLPAQLVDHQRADLTVNYRSPAEINEVATRILAELAPDLTPSQAIRSSGRPVRAVALDDVGASLDRWLAEHPARPGERTAVIGMDESGGAGDDHDIVHLRPTEAKGLEFDRVVVVEPAAILEADHGLAMLYVAVTRATHELVVAHHRPVPEVLGLPAPAHGRAPNAQEER